MNRKNAALVLLLFIAIHSAAQDKRAQYPSFLANSYFGVNIGYINYPFSNKHLAPGYTAESVKVPHVGVRINLLGYRFNENLSAEISYMRPVNWVEYHNINGVQGRKSVHMNIGGLTIRGRVPLSKKLAISGEAGLALVTRSGFKVNDVPVVDEVSYAGLLLGGRLQYHLNKKWEFGFTAAYSPKHDEHKQPATSFYSLGFNYHMRPLPEEKVERNRKSGYIWPRNLIQIGYTTNGLGYGANNFVSEGFIPIFWGGDAEVERGFAVHYQRNVFHTRKVFSLDWGVSASWYRTDLNKEEFFALSVFPVLRFTVLRMKATDIYFNYSVAGPSYISKTVLDGQLTGKKFTFQDFMAMGMYAGKNRNLNAELRIAHYSNGNIFTQNAGVKIPLTFNLGYTF
ncbi:MAG TPA: acyloxyacyl hydrolase [Chitinophagaceae bacterium]